MCKNAWLIIYLFVYFSRLKREDLVPIVTPTYYTKLPICSDFSTISSISGTSGHVSPMGEHPWMTTISIVYLTSRRLFVVKVFSLNRTISLVERQAFTHCCELLQV